MTHQFFLQQSPMSIQVKPLYGVMKRAKSARRTFMVSLSAPETNAHQDESVSLNLGVALDCSGSMQGKPLSEAKNAVLHLAKSLRKNDRLSLVTYADDVVVNMTSRTRDEAIQWLLEGLPHIGTRGMTALHAGWLGACGEIAPYVSQYGITRAIVLSDGQANVGETNPSILAKDAQELLDKGISVSTYGIGNNFNEHLMTALAQAGGGQSVYAENADALLGHFIQEMGMMHHAVARNIRLQVSWKGNKAQLENGTGYEFRAPFVLQGGETWALFSAPGDDVSGDFLDLHIECHWQNTDNTEHHAQVTCALALGEDNAQENKDVAARIAETQAAKLAEDVAKHVMTGNMAMASQSLNAMSALAGQSTYAADIHQHLSASLQSGDMAATIKEAHYSANNMRTRVADINDDGTGIFDRYATRKVVQGRAKEDRA